MSAPVCAIAGGGSQVARDLIALLEAAGWEVSAVDVIVTTVCPAPPVTFLPNPSL